MTDFEHRGGLTVRLHAPVCPICRDDDARRVGCRACEETGLASLEDVLPDVPTKGCQCAGCVPVRRLEAGDAVLLDALRATGHEHVTPWHLRCVEAYLAQLAGAMGADEYSPLVERLTRDLRDGLDAVHADALHDDLLYHRHGDAA